MGNFLIIAFFWVTGFHLAYMVVGVSGLDLVDREREEGTLLLVVSKPVSRIHFLLGKYAALVVSSMMVEAFVLAVTVVVLKIMLGLEEETVAALLNVLPWVFVFSLLVTLVFAGVSLAFSTVIRSSLVRNAIFTLTVLVVFAAGPIMRLAWPAIYEDYWLYYADGGYNLGNAYVQLLDQTEAGRLTSQTQAWLGIVTGSYSAGPEALLSALVGAGGAYDADIGALPPSMERSSYVSPLLSFTLIFVLAGGSFGVAAFALQREEVQ